VRFHSAILCNLKSAMTVGIAGGQLALLRRLPWGKNWHVGGYF
jgi:hypothetical protein